jgi:hypothetical protein
MDILDQLQRHMNKYGYSQRTVAPKIPMDRALLCKLFGRKKRLTPNHLNKIKAYLENYENLNKIPTV